MVWWGEAVEAWKGENWTGKMRSRSQGEDGSVGKRSGVMRQSWKGAERNDSERCGKDG